MADNSRNAPTLIGVVVDREFEFRMEQCTLNLGWPYCLVELNDWKNNALHF